MTAVEPAEAGITDKVPRRDDKRIIGRFLLLKSWRPRSGSMSLPVDSVWDMEREMQSIYAAATRSVEKQKGWRPLEQYRLDY